MGYLPSPWAENTDGLSDSARNCECGAGVKVLVDQFHAQCGVCKATSLTPAGLKEANKEYYEDMYAKMQKERDDYNAEHPGEI